MNIDGYALVTGAGSGIGKACALAYAAEGAAGVVFADLNKAAAESASAESQRVATNPDYRSIVVQVDVTDEASVDGMMSSMLREFGRIDYAVNCAGIGAEHAAEVAESSVPEFSRFLQVNVLGMFLTVRAETKAMKAQDPKPVSAANPKRGASRGVIVNMGSCSSYVATPQLVQYTTSKHAVLGLTRNAGAELLTVCRHGVFANPGDTRPTALDCAQHAIRINCLCPSWADTPMVRRAVEGNPGLQQLMEKSIPMGRIAEPDEISDIVVFLSSPRSSYVTGSGWIVDGGTTLSTNTG
ncbi:MAG: putative secondary metabolism biosynthetic enzyme [Peltula sp. TS41687]|nr:MAG: putative secondary metabolism biosynthetic enzyme [Peltula sp. TS41687]